MNEKKIYDFFAERGLSPCGIYGLMGNLRDESGLNPRNLQNSCEKKLGYTDDSYTDSVDSGAYTNFVYDAAGYGLAQWTYPARKENLIKYARQSGVSIGDIDMQLEFMYQELQAYKTVFAVLKTAVSIREASDAVLTKYEKPADQSEQTKERRAAYGQEICNMLSGMEQFVQGAGITEDQIRQRMVSTAVNWYGCKEADGSHQVIIDTYNGHAPLARGYKVSYTDPWCAAFGSAVAIAAGYADIIPTECGCGQMIALFQTLGRWVEDDAYIPDTGDYIFYDWDDSGSGDCTGWPEHVGIVISVCDSTIKVIEGNKNDAVGYREVAVNGQYIRGYGIPDYASKAGTEPDQNGADDCQTGSALPKSGTICKEVQWIGEVTASTLNVRRWSGTEYENIKSCPQLEKGNFVGVCDTVKATDGADWYYVQISSCSHGFVHSKYIKKFCRIN